MARSDKAELPDMDDEGSEVKARRERLGMTAVDLAKAAGIHRNTVKAIEDGESGHRATLLKVLRVLDEHELEAGIGAPEATPAPAEPAPSMVVIRLEPGGAVVIEGPVSDLAAIQAAAEELMRRMGQSPDSPE